MDIHYSLPTTPVTPTNTANLPLLPRRLQKTFCILSAIATIASPLKGQASEVVFQDATALQSKLTSLIANEPAKANILIDLFAKKIVDQNNLQPSIATQLTNEELIKLLTNVGSVIPAEYQIKVSGETEKLLRTINAALPTIFSSSKNSEEYITKLAANPDLVKYLGIIRNQNHQQKEVALTGLAKRLHFSRINSQNTVAVIDSAASLSITASEKQEPSVITHIQQDKKRCVSACGLMSLERLVGADFPFEFLPAIGDLYSDLVGAGTKGAYPSKLLPLLGLDTLSVDYATDMHFKNPSETATFSLSMLNTKIKNALIQEKFVVLSLEAGPLDHAILLVGVKENGDFIIHDPEASSARTINPNVLAKRWFRPDKKSLAASIITFPTPVITEKKELLDKVILSLDSEMQHAGISELGLKKGSITLQALQSASRTFNWVDMTSTSKEERNLSSMSGIPLIIKMQLLSGCPVKTVNTKGEPLLITGYAGGLKSSECQFQVMSKSSSEIISWEKLLRTIANKNEKGKETVYLGFAYNYHPELAQTK